MGDAIISVEGLGKRYTLHHQGRGSGEGLRHVLNDVVTAPLRWLRREAKAAPAREDFWALRDISFSVQRGDVLGVIGRNGAGKSTLLKLLSRITEPTEGRIRIRGRIASLLEVGTGFHPELTGRENIFLNGAILGMRRVEIRAKFDEMVAFAEVEKFLDTPVKRYSSGMYVRLAFAVAAHMEPEILVVDEVLAVGDAQFQKKCLGKMQEVSTREGRTVLFVSHQLAAIRRLCKSALLLQNGRAQGLTSVDEALAQYTREARETPASIDLCGFKRAAWVAGDARFMSVSIEPAAMAFGRELRVRCLIDATRRVEGAAVELWFDTLDGSRVMTIASDNAGGEVTLQRGLNEVILSMPRNPLTPGIYVCSAAVISGQNALDWTPACATWEVQAGGTERGFAGCRPEVSVASRTIR